MHTHGTRPTRPVQADVVPHVNTHTRLRTQSYNTNLYTYTYILCVLFTRLY